MSKKSREIFKAYLAAILIILTVLSAVDFAEAVPVDWTFTGHAEVRDPLGFPMANVPVFMEGWTRYNIRLERDPETGQIGWVYDIAHCSATGATDSNGRAMLRCSIPWKQAEEADSQRVWMDPCYNERERRVLSRDASTLSMSFVASGPPKVPSNDDAYVGSFSVLFLNTYLLNPEGPKGEAPDNACRGYYMGRALRELDYDIVALAETFDNDGRNGLWDQMNSYCKERGYLADNPGGGYSNCKYPAWVLNWPSASDGQCGRYCTETGGLSLLSKNPFLWNSSSTHTQHYKGDNMCGAVDCRAGKGFIRGEIKNIGGMHATNLQVYVTHTQANYHREAGCKFLGLVPVDSISSCGTWYHIRQRQMDQMARHSREHVKEGDGPVLFLGDFNIPARDFNIESINDLFWVYEIGREMEYDHMLHTLDSCVANVRDAYREVHPPDPDSSDPNVMLPYFTSNPTWNFLTGGFWYENNPWHGRIDYQIMNDSRSCYRLVPVSAEHIALQDPDYHCSEMDYVFNIKYPLLDLSDHYAVGVIYEVYRRKDTACNFVTDPPVLGLPIPTVSPPPYGSTMNLNWSDPGNPGVAYYELQYSEDGGVTWNALPKGHASHGRAFIHSGNLVCGEGYQYCLKNSQRYDYRVRALDHTQAPITEWSNIVNGTSKDWKEFQRPRNPGFEDGLTLWESYGDGVTHVVKQGLDGSYAVRLSRDRATGNYFGLAQRKIPCEPNTIYRLTLWLKTNARSGAAAAGLGNWGSPNTHQDFGWTGGTTEWKQVSGTWSSGENERTLDVVLYGTPDFSGEAFFDNLVLEKMGPTPLLIDIEGPSVLGFKEVGDYVAKVSAGSGDYGYQWNQRMDGGSAWYALGRERTQRVTMIDVGFILKVDIHDNRTGQNASATLHVESREAGGVKILP
jgi:hypothetical protein